MHLESTQCIYTLHKHLSMSQCEGAVEVMKCVTKKTLVVCVQYMMYHNSCHFQKAACEQNLL